MYAAFYDHYKHRYMDYLLSRQALEASNLTPQEKQAHLSVLDDVDLDIEQQFLKQPHIQLQHQAKTIEAQAQIDNVRAQYGQEAAIRDKQVLQQRSNFQQREINGDGGIKI